MPEIILLVHNIRSTHNVGSIFRTCEGFGVDRIVLSGYTPYPLMKNDIRLPHITAKLTKDIHKTALGAEVLVPFTYQEIPDFAELRKLGFTIVGLEQGENTVLLSDFSPPEKIALLIGEEVHGIGESRCAAKKNHLTFRSLLELHSTH
jgi:tRNA G18 (ribose-2'-O)-methylase SpoU